MQNNMPQVKGQVHLHLAWCMPPRSDASPKDILHSERDDDDDDDDAAADDDDGLCDG